ncbi:MAG: RICIN domain-containing protein [Capsulimonas sp.]|uniref:RICIN domain-containing protein n=1 Tax=Capsulimonas sp. TaxID=2494211 RepID=UPI0032644F7B
MKGFWKVMAAAVLALAAFTHSAPRALAQSDPVIKIHTGKYYDWYTTQSTWNSMSASITPDFPIFDNAIDRIVADWGAAPPTTRHYCYVDPSGQNGAYATGDIGQVSAARGASPSPGIGINSNLFTASGYGVTGGTAIVFGVHEAVNDMTGQLSAGWPRDWWADDKSPFPGMTEVHILNELGYTTIAANDDANLSGDPLYVMFKNIQNHYGWGIFSRMFSNMKTNHVNWTTVDSGHNPSAVLTNLVTAYMVMGSGDTLANVNAYFTSAIIPGYNINTTQTNLNSLGYTGGQPANGTYTITSVQTGLVLDAGANTQTTQVQLWGTNGSGPQRWIFTSLGNGAYSIKNATSALAADGGANTQGTKVWLYGYNGTVDQQWILSSTSNGYTIKSAQTSLVFDGGANTQGAKLQLWGSNLSVDQKWIVH